MGKEEQCSADAWCLWDEDGDQEENKKMRPQQNVRVRPGLNQRNE